MNYILIIRPEAEADLAEAFAWYENKRQGLGHDFLLQVEAGIKYIERMAETHPIKYKGTRQHLIKRFPYKIIYILEDKTVFVLAVIHGKRSAHVLQSRIKGE